MNIAITGASGFIGRRLTARLTTLGHSIRKISVRTTPLPEALAGCEAVVHLAGEPVAQRWTATAKQRIRESRVNVTSALVQSLRRDPPKVLVSASAVGYYGARGDDILTERDPPAGDFLGQICVAWEREANNAADFGVRVVNPRIGIVLGHGGGALERMVVPFRLGAGGRIGNGRQWMPWIHLDDVCGLIEFAIGAEHVRGPMNATSPNLVTNAEFTRVLADVLHRPAIFPVPPAGLKLLLGEMAEVVLASQRVIPRAALDAGFNFQYTDLRQALEDILGR